VELTWGKAPQIIWWFLKEKLRKTNPGLQLTRDPPSPDGPNMFPRWLQHGFNMASIGHKLAPKWSQQQPSREA